MGWDFLGFWKGPCAASLCGRNMRRLHLLYNHTCGNQYSPVRATNTGGHYSINRSSTPTPEHPPRSSVPKVFKVKVWAPEARPSQAPSPSPVCQLIGTVCVESRQEINSIQPFWKEVQRIQRPRIYPYGSDMAFGFKQQNWGTEWSCTSVVQQDITSVWLCRAV